MTIEQLEALEHEGSSDRWESDVRSALASLLAVAKEAQKSLDQLSYILEVAHNEQQDEVLYPNMLAEIGTRREELREALYRLEAQ